MSRSHTLSPVTSTTNQSVVGVCGSSVYWLVAAALIQGLSMASLDARLFERLAAGSPAMDAALAEARAASGAVVLVDPAWVDDDDKRAGSPALWRLPPWRRMPAVTPYDFDYTDYRHGQPRRVGGITVYVHDHPRPTLAETLAHHGRLWIVVTDPRGRHPYTRDLPESVGGQVEWLGEEMLIRARAATGPP